MSIRPHALAANTVSRHAQQWTLILSLFICAGLVALFTGAAVACPPYDVPLYAEAVYRLNGSTWAFGVHTVAVCAGETVHFHAVDRGGTSLVTSSVDWDYGASGAYMDAARYKWDVYLGGQIQSSVDDQLGISYQFNSPGTYVVKLTVDDWNTSPPDSTDDFAKPETTLEQAKAQITVRVADCSQPMHVATSGNDDNDGRSWANAKRTIQNGIDWSPAGTKVWVAEGVYSEKVMPARGVKVYGGFPEHGGPNYDADESSRDPREYITEIKETDPATKTTGLFFPDYTSMEACIVDGFKISGFLSAVWLGESCGGMTVNNCEITGNTQAIGASRTPSSAVLSGNLIHGNGVIMAEAGPCNGPIFTNNTIADNSCWIEIGRLAAPQFWNNIIANNGHGFHLDDAGSIVLSNNSVYNNGSDPYPGSLNPQNAQDTNPEFLGGSPYSYRLSPDSPCLDTGSNAAPGRPSADFDGEVRIQPSGGNIDIGAFEDEADTTEPVIAITDPPDDKVYVAPGATSSAIGGDASDADTMVVAVDVKIGSGSWQSAAYDSDSHSWSFIWENPQSANIAARATDSAGNSATVSRDVTIVTYDTGWLTMSAYTTRYDEIQASWIYPNQASVLKYAVGTAPCRDDVYAWTATESPAATQITVSDLDLEDETTYYFSLKGLDAAGNLDRIGSCSFVTDLGADHLELQASPSTDREIGDSVTITASLTDCRNNPVSGRSITFEMMGVYDSTATATTNASGQASVTFLCSEEGWVNVIAHEYQPSLANVEESIDIQFKKPPLIEVLFLIKGNACGWYGFGARVRDTVSALQGLSVTTGVPVRFGGISVDARVCDSFYSYPHQQAFTQDDWAMSSWLFQIESEICYDCYPDNWVVWEALDGLDYASQMFSEDATLRYIAVVTNEPYFRSGSSLLDWCYYGSGCGSKSAVLQTLQDADCRVYIDQGDNPFWITDPNIGDIYSDLAVNGDVEYTSSWGFPKMSSDIGGILNPQEPSYGNPICDPGEGDFGDDLGGEYTVQEMSTRSSATVVPVMISTNILAELDPDRRYPYHNTGADVFQTQDGVIHVKFRGLAQLPPKQPYYRFIVRDPADESPYAKRTGTRKAGGDNYPQGMGNYGHLDAAGGINHQHHGRVVYAAPDASGKVELSLAVPHYSGNNYRIDMTPVGNAARILASSPVIVAWKRTYLETDRMYRCQGNNQGIEYEPSSDIVENTQDTPGYLLVSNVSNFHRNDEVIIFDSDHVEGEHRSITAIDPSARRLTLNSPLNNAYLAGYDTLGRGAAVVKADANTLVADLMGRLEEAYGDIHDASGATHVGCFVDFRKTAIGQTCLPYRSLLDNDLDRSHFRNVWFLNQAVPNAVYLPLVDTIASGYKGLTKKPQHWSYVSWRAANSGAGEAPDLQATAAHELFHEFFDVNAENISKGEGTDDEHANRPAWSWTVAMPRFSRRCIMDYATTGREYSYEMPCQFCRKHLEMVRKAEDPL